MLHPRAFFLFALLPMASQAGTPQAKPKPTEAGAVQGSILWNSVHLQSQRFDDQVHSFGRVELECDSFPQEEGDTRIQWQIRAESAPEARRGFGLIHADLLLEHLGWVRLSTADYQKCLKAYRNFPNLALASSEAIIYRPKDEATFKKALEGIELLGNRDLGRRAAMTPQIFLLVSLDQFTFEGGKSTFMVKFKPVLYGTSLDQSTTGSIGVGEIDAYTFSSTKLLEEVMALFKEHRPRLAPELDQPKPKAAQSKEGQEPRATPPAPVPAQPPSTSESQIELIRQQRIAFETNRRTVKILTVPDGAPGKEVVPRFIEVQRPDPKTIQFPSVLDSMESMPTLGFSSKELSIMRIQAHPQIAYKQGTPHLVYLGDGNPQGRLLMTTRDQLPLTQDGRDLDSKNLTLCMAEGLTANGCIFSTVAYFRPGIYALTFPPPPGSGVRDESTTRDYYLFRVENPSKP